MDKNQHPGAVIPLNTPNWKGVQMWERDGVSDLVALVDLFPYRTGTEKRLSITHLVGTLRLRSRLHRQDAVVKELFHVAQTTLFA